MIVLDTNVVSEMMTVRPSETVRAWFGQFDPQQIRVTSITKAELLYGHLLLPLGRRRDLLAAMIRDFFSHTLQTEILPFGDPAAGLFATIAADRRLAGRPIDQHDAQIAAISRRWGFALATRNVRDFEGCGIEVVNPWDHEDA